MFPVHQSIRDTRAHHRIGRTYFSDMAAAEPTTNATPNAPRATTTTTVRTNSRLLAVQQRLRTQINS
jgi:hypothetical protein